MTEKITADRIKEHLHYDWLKYLLVIFVCVFVFTLSYSWMGNLRGHERLECFITCYDFYDQEKFEADVLDYLNKVPNNSVKEVNAYYLKAESGSWAETLSAYSMDRGTILLILPESKMETYADMYMPIFKDGDEYYNQKMWDRIIPEGLSEHYQNAENLYRPTAKDDDGNTISDGDGNPVLMDEIYGLRVDNLKEIGASIKFVLTDAEAAEQRLEDYKPERYYLVMHYRNYNIGEYGMKEKYYSHIEGFEVIKYFLTRYGVEGVK